LTQNHHSLGDQIFQNQKKVISLQTMNIAVIFSSMPSFWLFVIYINLFLDVLFC